MFLRYQMLLNSERIFPFENAAKTIFSATNQKNHPKTFYRTIDMG